MKSILPWASAMRAAACFTSIFAAVVGRAPCQVSANRTYVVPKWKTAEGYSRVTGVRELGDGRVLLADAKQNELWLLDSSGKEVRQLSRVGSGPTEYRSLLAIIPALADSSYVVVRDQRRFLLIDPSGNPSRTFLFPDGLGTSAGSARAVDAKGRLLFTANDFGGSIRPTAPLIAWNPTSHRVDSLAELLVAVPKVDSVSVTNGFQLRRRLVPFSPEDGWAMLPGGRVMILRAKAGTPDILMPNGEYRKGAPLPWKPEPLTSREARDIQDKYGVVPPPFKPGFDPAGIWSSPDGEVWVQSNFNSKDPARFFVLNSDGKGIATAVLPAGRYLISLSRSRVYTGFRDDDGFVWVEGYAR